jgi:outer membrane protein OmpA-like peptidoglycan-associated protein
MKNIECMNKFWTPFFSIFFFLLIGYQSFAKHVMIYVAEGITVHEDTDQAIAGVEITIVNKKDKQSTRIFSDSSGRFSVILLPNKVYELQARHTRFFANTGTVVETNSRMKVFDVKLRMKEIVLGTGMRIENVTFGVNDAHLTEESHQALDKVYKLLFDNAHIKTEIAIHTDSRGDDDYNLVLSQHRAESIVKYLTDKGIEPNRLLARGYGETKLINRCANGVRCSSVEHQQNRRIELIVTGFF